MSLTKLTDNLNEIQSLADKPTQTATQLKQAFDNAGNTIKDYINNTLTSEIDTVTSSQSNSIASLSNTVSGLKSGATTKITIGSSVPSSLENGEVYLQYFN